MTTIATTKDALAQARVRMEKAVEDFRKDLASDADGAGECDAARFDSR